MICAYDGISVLYDICMKYEYMILNAERWIRDMNEFGYILICKNCWSLFLKEETAQNIYT